jgi:hypothetical protein
MEDCNCSHGQQRRADTRPCELGSTFRTYDSNCDKLATPMRGRAPQVQSPVSAE